MNLAPPTHGIHDFLPSAARKCRNAGMTATETAHRLASLEYRRPVPESEIRAAVNLVFETELEKTTSPKAPKPLGWQRKATEQIHAEIFTTEQDLVAMSDVHPSDIDQRELIRALFPDSDGLLCIGSAFNRFITAPLAEHKALASAQYIVPCYMTARIGITQEGRKSCRAKSNTGERRYIVLDFDEPPSDQQPSIIHWLMQYRAPLLVIKSGGKSLHAWYKTETQDRDAQFWRLALMAGADKVLHDNHAQAVRMPMGKRDNGNVQSVLYFNPHNLPV